LTVRVREALELFEVELLEHFVVGDGAVVVGRRLGVRHPGLPRSSKL
jgi:DNA repair protein RadC